LLDFLLAFLACFFNAGFRSMDSDDEVKEDSLSEYSDDDADFVDFFEEDYFLAGGFLSISDTTESSPLSELEFDLQSSVHSIAYHK